MKKNIAFRSTYSHIFCRNSRKLFKDVVSSFDSFTKELECSVNNNTKKNPSNEYLMRSYKFHDSFTEFFLQSFVNEFVSFFPCFMKFAWKYPFK